MSSESLKDLFQPVPRRHLSRSVEQGVQESLAASPPKPGGKPPLTGTIPHRLIPDDKRFAGIAMGGAPAWAVRLKRIETLRDRLVTELAGDWHSLARQPHTAASFAQAWRDRLSQVDLHLVNELIRRHNRYFPAEANLPMSPRTGDYIGWGGREWRCRPVSADDLLDMFPPDLDWALSARTGRSTAEPPTAA